MDTQSAPLATGSKRPPRNQSITWDQFVALPDNDRRELIDGELIEVEVPTNLHEYIVTTIIFLLTQWARPRHAGVVYASGYKVRVNEKRGVMPDVQFYRIDNPVTKTAGKKYLQGAVDGRPDLAVEVISPGSVSMDRVRKLNWYLQIGVPEYWVIDSVGQTLERFILRDGAYVVSGASGDDVFKPETFPGLEIPLTELWSIPGQDAEEPPPEV